MITLYECAVKNAFALREHPVSDAIVFPSSHNFETTGFRRLHFGSILPTESGFLYPFFAASKTGSFATQELTENAGVRIR
jgi:hypothetical protein